MAATWGDDDSKPKWGDEEEYADYELGHEIVTEESPEQDGSIRKTIVEYTTNAKGQKVKVIKKIREFKTQIKMNKKVEERRKWRKFGECANVGPGPEKGITSLGDEIDLDLARKDDDDEKKEAKTQATKDTAINLGIVCRNCGIVGDHWTLKCPYFKEGRKTDEAEAPRTPPLGGAMGPSKYVPPSMRPGGRGGAAGPGADSSDPRRRDETATIRVTNLSEDTKETDLNELFRPFGPISRIYLAKDKIRNLSKGFAFVNFVHREDAARAIAKLDGFGYDNLILHLEWAKPSNK